MICGCFLTEYGIIKFKKNQTPESVEPQPFPGWRNLCARILRKTPDQTCGIAKLKKKVLRLISAKFEAPLCSKTKSPLTNAAMLMKMKSQLRKSPRFKYNAKDKTATLLVFSKKNSKKSIEKFANSKKTKKVKSKKVIKANNKKKTNAKKLKEKKSDAKQRKKNKKRK